MSSPNDKVTRTILVCTTSSLTGITTSSSTFISTFKLSFKNSRSCFLSICVIIPNSNASTKPHRISKFISDCCNEIPLAILVSCFASMARPPYKKVRYHHLIFGSFCFLSNWIWGWSLSLNTQSFPRGTDITTIIESIFKCRLGHFSLFKFKA